MSIKWKGPVEINGTRYEELPASFVFTDNMNILLCTNTKSSASQDTRVDEKEYHVTVRQYMTKKATPEFDFMQKWNKDVPMPLCSMVGTVVKETRGMVYMKLHADTNFRQVPVCMKCGRAINNAVSQFFGMGPECGGHNYVNPFDSTEELNDAIEEYKQSVLSKITWEGWIIKSAILTKEEIHG